MTISFTKTKCFQFSSLEEVNNPNKLDLDIQILHTQKEKTKSAQANEIKQQLRVCTHACTCTCFCNWVPVVFGNQNIKTIHFCMRVYAWNNWIDYAEFCLVKSDKNGRKWKLSEIASVKLVEQVEICMCVCEYPRRRIHLHSAIHILFFQLILNLLMSFYHLTKKNSTRKTLRTVCFFFFIHSILEINVSFFQCFKCTIYIYDTHIKCVLLLCAATICVPHKSWECTIRWQIENDERLIVCRCFAVVSVDST